MPMSRDFLPYGRQVIEDDDVAAVAAVLRSDYLTTGPEVPLFEAAFCEATGAAHAIACANGTAALHLIALAHGIGPGCAVVVPTITFLATANAPRFCGAEIVFADVDAATGLMTPATLKAAFARAMLPVRAVIAVHLAGQACDLPGLAAVCREARDVALFEDACHAIGTRHRIGPQWHLVGDCACSHAAAFSLHPVKTIAAGEGGVVTTNDDAFADRLRLLRGHGMVRDAARFTDRAAGFAADGQMNPWAYEMPEPGLNYRLSDIQAALARSQLSKLERFAAVRSAIAAQYDALLTPLAPGVLPLARVADCEPVLHLYQARLDFTRLGIARGPLMRRLAGVGIGTQVHYTPVHTQPYYRRRYPGLALPDAEAFYARTLSLPLFADMTAGDVERVVRALADALS